jgi:hypothetical protein
MFVFSQDGLYLYVRELEQLKGRRVRAFACDDESFVFLAFDWDLYIGYMETKGRK